MALLLVLLLLTSIVVSMLQWGNAQPSPGYYPSNRFKSLPGFYHGYSTLWGPQHQTVSGDQSSVTIWLDRSSGMHARHHFAFSLFDPAIAHS